MAQADSKPVRQTLQWLTRSGVTETELRSLNPCIPGEFTLPGTLYVNTATPGTVYVGSEEGTLPLVAGRWYIIPGDVVRAHPSLVDGAAPPARAVRLAR